MSTTITTTTTMMTTAAAVTIMTTITRSTSIITTITTTATSAPAAATITIMSTTITTMLTRSSPAGAWRHRASSLRRAFKKILEALDESAVYGTILRAKGIVDASDGDWLYFDYTPGEYDVRRGNAAVTGRFCVIGSKLNEQALKELFEVE